MLRPLLGIRFLGACGYFLSRGHHCMSPQSQNPPAGPETGIVAVGAIGLGKGAAWSLIPPFGHRRNTGELLARRGTNASRWPPGL
jgi:hypothetical protein